MAVARMELGNAPFSWLGHPIGKMVGGTILSPFRKDPTCPNTWTTSGTLTGQAIRCGVVLPSGKIVVIVANTSAPLRIYDPDTNTVSDSCAVPWTGDNQYLAAVLLNDGRVYCIPFQNSTAMTAYIYDPIANTFSSPPGVIGPTNRYMNGVLLNDGRVYMPPCLADGNPARIYDPTTNALTNAGGTFVVASPYPTVLPDGRVLCVSRVSGEGGYIYDPATDTLAASAISFPCYVCGGTVLHDGRIYFATTSGSGQIGVIYDPISDSLTTIPGTVNQTSGGCLFPDGTAMNLTDNVGCWAKFVNATAKTTVTLLDGPWYHQFALLMLDGRAFTPNSYKTHKNKIYSHMSTRYRLPRSTVLCNLMNYSNGPKL